jgi:hypothetical protein
MQMLRIFRVMEGIRFEFKSLSCFEILENNQTGAAHPSAAALRPHASFQTGAATIPTGASSSPTFLPSPPVFTAFKSNARSSGETLLRFASSPPCSIHACSTLPPTVSFHQ